MHLIKKFNFLVFFLFSLSWGPSLCAMEGEENHLRTLPQTTDEGLPPLNASSTRAQLWTRLQVVMIQKDTLQKDNDFLTQTNNKMNERTDSLLEILKEVVKGNKRPALIHTSATPPCFHNQTTRTNTPTSSKAYSEKTSPSTPEEAEAALPTPTLASLDPLSPSKIDLQKMEKTLRETNHALREKTRRLQEQEVSHQAVAAQKGAGAQVDGHLCQELHELKQYFMREQELSKEKLPLCLEASEAPVEVQRREAAPSLKPDPESPGQERAPLPTLGSLNPLSPSKIDLQNIMKSMEEVQSRLHRIFDVNPESCNVVSPPGQSSIIPCVKHKSQSLRETHPSIKTKPQDQFLFTRESLPIENISATSQPCLIETSPCSKHPPQIHKKTRALTKAELQIAREIHAHEKCTCGGEREYRVRPTKPKKMNVFERLWV